MKGHLEVLLELCFFTKPLKFGVETHMEAPTGVALVKQLPNPEPDGSHRVLIHEMIPGRQTIIRPPFGYQGLLKPIRARTEWITARFSRESDQNSAAKMKMRTRAKIQWPKWRCSEISRLERRNIG
jgi:hypothetical protein